MHAVVFPENGASVALHRGAGFRLVGRRERIARLAGRWQDTLLLERRSPCDPCPRGGAAMSEPERLRALVDTTDGFELAEVDLDLRGGGHLLGTRQSGLSDLRFARLRSDRPLLEQARAAAAELAYRQAEALALRWGDQP